MPLFVTILLAVSVVISVVARTVQHWPPVLLAILVGFLVAQSLGSDK